MTREEQLESCNLCQNRSFNPAMCFSLRSLALIIGLIVYIAVMLLLAFLEPSSIINGIICKVFIIYSLVYSIKTARSEEAKIKKTSVDLLDEI